MTTLGAPIQIGDLAPDFTLTDTHGSPLHLADLRGTPVALVFMPGAFTGTCTGEVCELRDNLSLFGGAGVRLLLVACDSTATLRAWGEQERTNFDLLSDIWPHGACASNTKATAASVMVTGSCSSMPMVRLRNCMI